MTPSNLMKGAKYNDASRLYPSMINPLEYIGFDKESGCYEFWRLNMIDRSTRRYKVYIGEYSVNDYVRPI